MASQRSNQFHCPRCRNPRRHFPSEPLLKAHLRDVHDYPPKAKSPALDWEPSREVKGLQGAIHLDQPVHRVTTKETVQEGLFRTRPVKRRPSSHRHPTGLGALVRKRRRR